MSGIWLPKRKKYDWIHTSEDTYTHAYDEDTRKWGCGNRPAICGYIAQTGSRRAGGLMDKHCAFCMRVAEER